MPPTPSRNDSGRRAPVGEGLPSKYIMVAFRGNPVSNQWDASSGIGLPIKKRPKNGRKIATNDSTEVGSTLRDCFLLEC